MKERTFYQKTAIEDIKRRVATLNLTFVLIAFLILLLTVRFMYKFLNYIPFYSAITMLAIMAVLILAGFLLINVISRNAIKTIDIYSNKLNTLLTTSRDLHEIVHSDILLEKIMDVSQKITGADGGSLALLEGDKCVFKVLKGDKIGSLPEIAISNCVGILGWAIGNNKIIRVDDTEQDLRFYPEIDEVTGRKTKSALGAPLKLSSGVIGALELVSENKGAFNKEDEEIIAYFADQAALSIKNAKFYEDEKNFQIHLTNILGNINDKVAGKQGHSKRVAKYTLLMAQAINLSGDEQTRLYRASLLHDIGFLNIRHEGVVLSIDDYRSHSQLGYEMLKPINFYTDITKIILHHHERYDGKGYPYGLKGEAIPIESRMIAIAEAFDAMVSKDSYKSTVTIVDKEVMPQIVEIESAIEELKRNANTQFDPGLVEVFVKNISEDFLE